MIRLFSQTVCWFSSWRRFCALLTLIFLARGVFVLSVLPPFEGWDEYQHIAYVVFLLENDRPPVLHEDNDVPRSLYAELVKYPHSRLAVGQLGGIGALSYDEFWDAAGPPSVSSDPPKLLLYQAQHAAFYYRLVSPLYSWLKTSGGILGAVTGLRGLNLLFGAGAIYIALWGVGRLVTTGSNRYLLGLLIALQPLFLVNCLRVANDALAIVLGTITIVFLLVMTPRRHLIFSLAAGLTLGLGVLAKAIDLVLLPFVVWVFVSLAWQQRLTVKQSFISLVLVLGAMTAITFPYYFFNLTHFGVLVPMEQAVLNQDSGRTISDFLTGLAESHWWNRCVRLYFRYNLWIGGWSRLKVPGSLMDLHQVNIILSIVGGCLALRASVRRRNPLFAEPQTVTRIAVLCLGVAAGLFYHGLHAQVAWGAFIPNSWYAAISFPWLLCLFFQGIVYFPYRWMTHLLGAQMLALFLATEIYGTLVVMVREYTGHGWDAVGWDRLEALHLPGLGPAATFPALGLVAVLVLLAVGVWISAVRAGGKAKLPDPASNA